MEQAGELSPQPGSSEGVVEIPAPVESAEEPEKNAAIKLADPSKEMAARLLSPVGPGERLIGCFTAGPESFVDMFEPLYSLKAVADFMPKEVSEQSRYGSIGYIGLETLERWIRETLHDEELADAISEQAGESDDPNSFRHFLEHGSTVIQLVNRRVEQCLEIAGPIETVP
jgi:hypothetical protein